MTSETLAEARRRIRLCVPRAGDADTDASVGRMVPVSFSLVEFGGERLIFRLADGQGKLLDLMLNPAVTVAFRDCILAEYLNNGPSRPSAALGEGQVE